ncbi:MAG: hypothetical protein M4579_007339 [Chaenotheca gracillima]|nr:MAG: hypothetical protein M4579_007339 [Chaenotheca gracillima]
MYWFDPVPFFTTMLSSNSFVSQLHLGMADFVDEPKELWHSRSWASSIRASSGKYALFPDGQPAFPSDIVIFGCSRDLCQRCRDRNWHIGRILAVGRDFTSNGFTGRATSGQIALKVQTLLQQSELPESIISKLGPATPQSATELFLVEDEQFFVGEKDLISREEDVFLNYMFDLSGGGSDITVSQKLFIQRSVDLQSGRSRPLNMTTPPRGQLELESLMGVYIILAGMNIAERFRRANVFPITLGPHGSNFEDVVKALRQLAVLDGGVDIDLNGEKVHITAFVLAFTGDMPQQQANSGFMGPRANRSCRYCLVDKAERRNLDFDVAQQGRYHHQTVRLRREAMSKNKTQKASFHQHLGMTPLPSPLVNIAPALDIIRSRPSDPAHSEYLGIAEPAHALLIHDILTNRGQVAYNEVLRHFPFPPGWARLQSPLRHFGSYSIQEHARASIVVPILLRCWLKESLIRASFTMGIRQVFREEAQLYSPVDLIVRCFGAMAKSHSILMSQSLSQADKGRMMDIIKEGRRSYQKLFEAAALAVGSSGRRSCGSTPASPSRTPSPSSVRSPEPNILTTTTDEEPSQADPGETSSVPTKKAHEYRNSQGRPNIHIALHYPDIIEEYGTAFNCNVLMGEDKHKFFKKIIYQSNHRSPERMLLGRECLQQTVRFLLAGSYAATEADLTSKMDRLHRSCPSVFKAILPPSEYLEESDESKLGLMSDNIHQDPTAIGCIPTNFARDTLDLPIRLNHRRVDDPFVASLIKAYDIDYGIRHVVELGRLPLQWCKKFSFTKATTNKRLSFQVGDYITFRQDCVGRIDYIFVHEIVRGDRRMFLWVTMVETCQPQQQEKDNVLGLPLLKLKDAKSVVGLPAVSGERIYMVPLKERDGVVSDDGEEKLLHCTWQIDFL